jgi:hypothetical protein
MKYKITSSFGIAAALAVAGLASQASSNQLPRCTGSALAAHPSTSIPALHRSSATEGVDITDVESIIYVIEVTAEGGGSTVTDTVMIELAVFFAEVVALTAELAVITEEVAGGDQS